MKRSIFTIPIILVIIVITFAVYFEISYIANTYVDITSGSASVNANCTNTKICFHPNPVIISVGDTVTWTNKDLTSHTVTSGKANADYVGALFDSKIIQSGKAFKFTFTKVGIYDYFCVLHPWMQGQVIVK